MGNCTSQSRDPELELKPNPWADAGTRWMSAQEEALEKAAAVEQQRVKSQKLEKAFQSQKDKEWDDFVKLALRREKISEEAEDKSKAEEGRKAKAREEREREREEVERRKREAKERKERERKEVERREREEAEKKAVILAKFEHRCDTLHAMLDAKEDAAAACVVDSMDFAIKPAALLRLHRLAIKKDCEVTAHKLFMCSKTDLTRVEISEKYMEMCVRNGDADVLSHLAHICWTNTHIKWYKWKVSTRVHELFRYKSYCKLDSKLLPLLVAAFENTEDTLPIRILNKCEEMGNMEVIMTAVVQSGIYEREGWTWHESTPKHRAYFLWCLPPTADESFLSDPKWRVSDVWNRLIGIIRRHPPRLGMHLKVPFLIFQKLHEIGFNWEGGKVHKLSAASMIRYGFGCMLKMSRNDMRCSPDRIPLPQKCIDQLDAAFEFLKGNTELYGMMLYALWWCYTPVESVRKRCIDYLVVNKPGRFHDMHILDKEFLRDAPPKVLKRVQYPRWQSNIDGTFAWIKKVIRAGGAQIIPRLGDLLHGENLAALNQSIKDEWEWPESITSEAYIGINFLLHAWHIVYPNTYTPFMRSDSVRWEDVRTYNGEHPIFAWPHGSNIYIEKDVSPEQLDNLTSKVLHPGCPLVVFAAMTGDSSKLEWLLSKGCSKEQTWGGQTALTWALLKDHDTCAQLLRDNADNV